MARDYYEVLGIKRNASTDDIKKAFRGLARQYHPDIIEEENAEAKIKEINEAYAVLSDEQKRFRYDGIGQGVGSNSGPVESVKNAAAFAQQEASQIYEKAVEEGRISDKDKARLSTLGEYLDRLDRELRVGHNQSVDNPVRGYQQHLDTIRREEEQINRNNERQSKKDEELEKKKAEWEERTRARDKRAQQKERKDSERQAEKSEKKEKKEGDRPFDLKPNPETQFRGGDKPLTWLDLNGIPNPDAPRPGAASEAPKVPPAPKRDFDAPKIPMSEEEKKLRIENELGQIRKRREDFAEGRMVESFAEPAIKASLRALEELGYDTSGIDTKLEVKPIENPAEVKSNAQKRREEEREEIRRAAKEKVRSEREKIPDPLADIVKEHFPGTSQAKSREQKIRERGEQTMKIFRDAQAAYSSGAINETLFQRTREVTNETLHEVNEELKAGGATTSLAGEPFVGEASQGSSNEIADSSHSETGNLK
jgi:curved DNA-binding protein CbpA